MTTDREKPQEKIEVYYRKLDTWTNSSVRASAVLGVGAGVSVGSAFAIGVGIIFSSGFVFFYISLLGALLGGLLGGFLGYAAVRIVYAVVVGRGRVSSKFIVYTDAKAEQFFIDALPARDATTAMKKAPCLKLIEPGGPRGLSIISGKLADFPYAKKIIDSEGITKGDNLSAKWNAIKDAMIGLAKEDRISGGRHGNSFIHEALEAAGSPVFDRASKAYSESEIGHFKRRHFMLIKISKMLVLLSVFLGVSLGAFYLSFPLSTTFSEFSDSIVTSVLGEKTVLEEKTQNIAVNTFQKLSELVESEWEIVCVLTPYMSDITGLEKSTILEKKQVEFINKKIDQLEWWYGSLNFDGNSSYIIFLQGERFDYSIFKRGRLRIELEQNNFDQALLDKFDQINFAPKHCTYFEQAAIFRFRKYNSPYITLGEIND